MASIFTNRILSTSSLNPHILGPTQPRTNLLEYPTPASARNTKSNSNSSHPCPLINDNDPACHLRMHTTLSA